MEFLAALFPCHAISETEPCAWTVEVPAFCLALSIHETWGRMSYWRATKAHLKPVSQKRSQAGKKVKMWKGHGALQRQQRSILSLSKTNIFL